MNARPARLGLAIAAITALLAAAATPAQQAEATPDEVVRSFNRAVTARDLGELLGHFAEGGVQFNLRPSHGGLDAGPLTQELTARWSMVGPVLFSATSAYERNVAIVDVHEAGDVATVWADVDTRTVMSGSGEASTERFTEVYLLVRKPGGWRIAGVADNRQPDDIGIGSN